MDGERHGVAVSVCDERDPRPAAVLYRIADQIRHDLGQSVRVSLASQVSGRFQAYDGVRLADAELDQAPRRTPAEDRPAVG